MARPLEIVGDSARPAPFHVAGRLDTPGPARAILRIWIVNALALCVFGIWVGSAGAQAPPRDDSHWVVVPGTRSVAGNAISSASAIDPNGRVVVGINVRPNPNSAGGFTIVARYDTLASTWNILGGFLRFGIVGARGLVAKANGDVYVAGNIFEAVASNGTATPAIHIAKWDDANQQWDNLGGGLDGPVESIVEASNGDVCVGGSFLSGATSAGPRIQLRGVGCWTGNTWLPLGDGVTGTSFPLVRSIVAGPAGELVVTGGFSESFDMAGGPGVPRNRIARWAGGIWHDLGGGLDSDPITVAHGAGADVFAAGSNVIGVNGANAVTGAVLKFDGTTWALADAGLPSPAFVRSIHATGNETTYSVIGRRVYRLAPGSTTWILAGEISTGSVSSSAATPASTDEFYIGGSFAGVAAPGQPAVPATNHARWNGHAWVEMDDGSTNPPDDDVVASSIVGGAKASIAFGGAFTKIGAFPVNRIALFDGDAWQTFGNGITAPDSARVFAVESTNQSLLQAQATVFAGGMFTEIRQSDGTVLPVSNVAGFVRSMDEWFSLGQGVDGPVYAIRYWDGPANGDEVVYVGGAFRTATNFDGSTVDAFGIARYVLADHRWEALAGGAGSNPNIDGSVSAVYSIDVGRRFATAPDGPNRYDHDVFVGGRFDGMFDGGGAAVGGTKNIAWFSAREDRWRPTGSGADDAVFALKYIRHTILPFDEPPYTFDRGVLYAGGAFRVMRQGAGAVVVANRIAKWRIDTDTWSHVGADPVNNGVDDTVRTLEFYQPLTAARWVERVGLVVGGNFASGTGGGASTVALNNIAILVDTEPLYDRSGPVGGEYFVPFGSGTDGAVRTTATLHCPQVQAGETTYAGGSFATAGQKPSKTLAKWTYSLSRPARALTVFNGGTTCTNCSASATGPLTSSTCMGQLAKSHSATTSLFENLSYGGSALIDDQVALVDVPLTIEIFSDAGAIGVADSVTVETVLPTILVLTGLDDPAGYAPNPEGRATGIAMHPAILAPANDAAPGDAMTTFFNAVTDAPSVDVWVNGVLAAEAVPYGEPARNPIVVTAGSNAVEIRHSADGVTIGTFSRVFPSGASAAILSGFLDPSSNNNGPAMDLNVVDPEALAPVGIAEQTTAESGLLVQPTFPNPTSTATTVRYQLPEASEVRLVIFDAIGRTVAMLDHGIRPTGWHDMILEVDRLPSGMYFVVVQAANTSRVRQLVVSR